MANAVSPTRIKVAIAAVTMAFAMLGFSVHWGSWDSRHGARWEGIVVAMACPFIGAGLARVVARFRDGRTVLSLLVGLGGAAGLWVGTTTCASCDGLVLPPAGIAWIASWSLAGAFLGTLPRVSERHSRLAGCVPGIVLAGILVLLLTLLSR